MKNFVLLWLLAFSWLGQNFLQAQDSTNCSSCSLLSLQFDSYETDIIDGELQVSLNFNAHDRLSLLAMPRVETNGYFGVSYPQSYETLLMEKDSLKRLPIHLTYNASNLPYYPVEIRLYQSFFVQGHNSSISRSVFVYFTPYNTIEIWDDADFQSLSRKWLHGDELTAPIRRYISKDSIPTSDISKGYEAMEGEAFDYRFIEGLGYAIPMLYPSFEGFREGDSTQQKVGNDGRPLYWQLYPRNSLGRYE